MNARNTTRRPDALQILRRHREYQIVAAIALALLYAEEAWGLGNLFPHRSPSELILFMLGTAGLVLVGTLAAFFYPLRTADPSKYPRAWGVMVTAMIQSAAISIGVSIAAFVLFLWLVNFDLTAVSTVLKDVYLFTLITIVMFHALVLYVRYMHYLYEEFGGSDHAAKPITATGGLGAVILIVGLWLFGFDINAVNTAPEAIRSIVSLHVYVRDLYLWTLVFMAYAWHLRWIADH